MLFAASRYLQNDGVTIEVVNHHAIRLGALLIHEACHADASTKSVVVVNNRAVRDQSGPDPFRNVPGRFIDIDIDVTKAECAVFDKLAGVIRENALQYIDALKT